MAYTNPNRHISFGWKNKQAVYEPKKPTEAQIKFFRRLQGIAKANGIDLHCHAKLVYSDDYSREISLMKGVLIRAGLFKENPIYFTKAQRQKDKGWVEIPPELKEKYGIEEKGNDNGEDREAAEDGN